MFLEVELGETVEQVFMETEKRREQFCKMVKGSILEDITEKLDAFGYFVCPAGKKHHGAHPGGLYDHSLAVSDRLVDYTEKMGLVWERQESPIIIGMLHDICKTQQYDIIADKENGYKIEWNNKNMLAGHGELSQFMACGLLELTTEEMMCIRYHMGAYEGKQVWDTMSEAIKNYPNILYVQLADMYASQVEGI